MPKTPKSLLNRRPRNNRRGYQADLRRVGIVRRIWRRIPGRAVAGTLLALAAIAGIVGLIQSAGDLPRALADRMSSPAPPVTEPVSKEAGRQLLDERAFNNLTEKSFSLPVDGRIFQVETTLDVDLQNYLRDKIDGFSSLLALHEKPLAA